MTLPVNSSRHEASPEQRSDDLLHDRYAIGRVLGRGGFGVTYIARDMQLPGRPRCVIKQLCPKVQDPSALKKARQRFEQEARTLARLGSHSQIPQLLDYFEIEGEFYLAQEFVRGRTLAQDIRKSGVWSEQAVKQFLKEFLPLLHYVHRQKVIHRDIKPSNIVWCKEDGRWVLIDFGAVKERCVAPDYSERSMATHFVGTIGFAPPEQIAMRPTYASDLYALGVTCLYLMSGRIPNEQDYDPYTGELNWQNLARVSDHFERILDKMLKSSTHDRFKSADEILRMLELEDHLETLRPCLSHYPLSQAELEPENLEFVSPLVRTAIAIRAWQARLAARQSHEKNR
ncbi:MAG: serine/threonine protein kinase [Leptolyngbya sp. UWPOB_LEPTO1]|uniref:serine/threonine-protein kinase n=1 Tax=Leptolyngbya sp. UWPOB_LEPTO1 TaxID=2815653 RepID=UPI001ACE8168|nr:serine/threonine-protein kinase [Leptolyngbya sp. UWPOB_LEPTO1]MBN8561690.1 serine/threonine protein kinase [Leptolyngbya sp. UWPOB_LEPTO1]